MPNNRACGTRKPQPSKTCTSLPHLIGGLGNQNLFSDPTAVDLESLRFFDLVRNESTTVVPGGMTQPFQLHVPAPAETQIPDVSGQMLPLRPAIDIPQHFIHSETSYANFTLSPWQSPYYTVPTLPSSGDLYTPVPVAPYPYQSFFPSESSGQAILALFQGGQADHVGVASSSHHSPMYDSTSLYQYPANPTDSETPQLYINQGMGHDTGFAQGFEPAKWSPIINTSLNDRLGDGGAVHSQATVPKLHVATEGVRKNAQKRRKHPGKHICGICGHDFTAAHNLKHHINSHNGLRKFSCNQCDGVFGTKHVLRRHELKKHASICTSKKPAVH
ncbi:hypothetical protein VKT23_018851 [Stygiomarasmius scandens]|uniref:C2H2-type domain-containing protein n=1 Tax=Marasmiellus scandens TaxID=2682957 RepID=A0ABR1IN36_9AGAR